jgi:transposase
MKKTTRYLGLDVHAESIAVAVAEAEGEVWSVGTIPNRIESIRKVIKKLGPLAGLKACYEAGPCGYVLYWQLTELGVDCEVVAPTLVPVKPGDRVKTDRRDARKLARSYRAGELTPVWVPDREQEALRDLVRARQAAKDDQRRARHRLSKFLLRHNVRRPAGMAVWKSTHREWLGQIRFEGGALAATQQDYLHEVDHQGQRIVRLEQAIDRGVEGAPARIQAVIAALQALRGVAKTTAVGLVAEVGEFSRFAHPTQLMGYAGGVPSERSSGERIRRGSITKTGNGHLRRMVTESSWSYRHGPGLHLALRKRQQGLAPEVTALAWQAQVRLCQRYRALVGRGKPSQKAVTAVARELLGFLWSIAVHVEAQHRRAQAA